MEFLTAITDLLANFSPYLEIITSFVGSFALIAAMTPNETDNQIVDAIYKLINLFGANVGNAKNG